MSNIYPFESLYFNTLFATEKPENFSEHWDYNYWNISGNQALEYILKHDKSSKIRISSHSINLKNAYLFLDLNDRKRVEFANNEKEVEYYIERHLPFFKFYQNLNPLVWHRIQRNNNTIATIFKMKQ